MFLFVLLSLVYVGSEFLEKALTYNAERDDPLLNDPFFPAEKFR